MPYIDVDTAVELFVNILPLTSDSDFTTRDTGVAYNEAGMDLVWNFITTAGVVTQTAITPTNTGGDYDWTHVGDGMYKIEIPASGGASVNNNQEGTGWFTGICTGVLSWISPMYTFRAAALNNALIDGGDELDVNVTQFGGSNGTFSGGRPEVNLTHINNDSGPVGVLELFAGVLDQSTGQIDSGTFAAAAIDAAAIATDAAQEIRNAVTGGAYALDTDANGRIRIVDGTGAGEINTASGVVQAALADSVTHGGAAADLLLRDLSFGGTWNVVGAVVMDNAGNDIRGVTPVATADDAVLAAIAALNNLSSANVTAAVWHADVAANDNTVGSFGDFFGQTYQAATVDIQSQIAALNDLTAQQVWEYATRLLTAGTNIALAKGTGVTGFNDIAVADVWSGRDLYHADINFAVDEANTKDEYTVTWFKNGVRQTSVTGGQIQVVKRADGTDLIAAATNMTQIASTGSWKYDGETTERTTAGEAVIVIVTATIDAGTRTFSRVVSRDSEAAP